MEENQVINLFWCKWLESRHPFFFFFHNSIFHQLCEDPPHVWFHLGSKPVWKEWFKTEFSVTHLALSGTCSLPNRVCELNCMFVSVWSFLFVCFIFLVKAQFTFSGIYVYFPFLWRSRLNSLWDNEICTREKRLFGGMPFYLSSPVMKLSYSQGLDRVSRRNSCDYVWYRIFSQRDLGLCHLSYL